MNTIAVGIAIKVNNRKVYAALPNVTWPTKATLKAMAGLKLARLKRQANRVIECLAMAIIPMPQCAAA
jgi:hypothetical protein